MKVALTGATGFVGSHLLADLHKHGHEVTALVRDDAQAEHRRRPRRHAGRGRPLRPAGRREAARQRGRGHPHGQSRRRHQREPGLRRGRRGDRRVRRRRRPTCRSAACGSTGPTPPSPRSPPFSAPPLVSWKLPIERRVLDATGMRGVVIVSSVAYGDGGGGIPGVLLGSPRDDAGHLIMLGTGQQHWSTVHAAGPGGLLPARPGRRVGPRPLRHRQQGQPHRGRADAGGRGRRRRPGSGPGSDDEARARLGDYFAEVLLLDQGTGAARARAELGWHPSHPSLTDEFRHGSYRN